MVIEHERPLDLSGLFFFAFHEQVLDFLGFVSEAHARHQLLVEVALG